MTGAGVAIVPATNFLPSGPGLLHPAFAGQASPDRLSRLRKDEEAGMGFCWSSQESFVKVAFNMKRGLDAAKGRLPHDQ
jgi:hypothetical protein